MSIMNNVFQNSTNSLDMVYFNDMLAYRNSCDEHVHYVKLVLEWLQKHKLYAELSNTPSELNELIILALYYAQENKPWTQRRLKQMNYRKSRTYERAPIVFWARELLSTIHM